MGSVKEMTLKAQTVQERVMSVVKAVSLTVATGTGTGVSVREFVFSHWAWFSPMVDALGIYTVAGLITLAVFLISAWLCLVAGCFLKVVEGISPVKERTPAGKARAAVRARQGRGVKVGQKH